MIKRIAIVLVLSFCFLFKVSPMCSAPSPRFDITNIYKLPLCKAKKVVRIFFSALLCDDEIYHDELGDNENLFSIFFDMVCGNGLDEFSDGYGR